MQLSWKKLSRTIIFSSAFFLFFSIGTAAADIGTVTASSLRIRSEANTNCATLSFISKGTKVDILSSLDGWYEIRHGDISGYVSADYLRVEAVASDAAAPAESSEASSVQEAPAELSMLTVTGDTVNLRSGAGTDFPIVGKVCKGEKLTALDCANGWYKVSHNGSECYISADYASPSGENEAVCGIVIGGRINVRTGPGTEYDRIVTVSSGKSVTILSKENGWYKVSFDSTIGYIKCDYVYEGSNATSPVGAQVSALAQNYLGVRYVYGGSSPNGFDCSGFTLYLYKQFGYSLIHSATAQYNNSGVYVSRDSLQPGDLVFFRSPSSSSISHVGIYIGNGNVIHARNSVHSVVINNLSESYYNSNYYGAKRIV